MNSFASSPVLCPKELTSEQIRQFHRHGYLVVSDFLDKNTIHYLHREIESGIAQQDLIEVRWIASHFDTFNGDAVDARLPLAASIYDQFLLHELRNIKLGIATIADRSIGLSVNLTPAHGKFQPHFDRNLLTAVLYVNDDYDGGEMVLYPRLRYWLGHPRGMVKKKVQRALDRYVRRQAYLNRFGQKCVLKPKAGDLLIFEGAKTYHAVQPVVCGNRRISIQFAYDRVGMTYDASDYYGKAKAA